MREEGGRRRSKRREGRVELTQRSVDPPEPEDPRSVFVALNESSQPEDKYKEAVCETKGDKFSPGKG